MSCKYKDILGQPNQGIHQYRLFNIAIIDVLLTILLALIIFYIGVYFKFFNHNIYAFIFVLLLLLIIGVILHYIFCVDTTINKKIFLLK